MKKPLVFYCVSVFLGYITALILVNNILLGAVAAASFLVANYLTSHKKHNHIIMTFFLLALLNYLSYFNPRIDSDKYYKIRISKIDKFTNEASINGRKVRLSGDTDNISEGSIIYGKGIFLKEPDYEKGIIGTFKPVIIKGSKRDFLSKLQEFKKIIYEKFSEQIGEKRAAVLVAACFGDVAYLQQEQKDELNRLGIVHIVSVSGLHMALIYKLLESIGGYGFGILVSFIYVIFTGIQASTVRAFIMIVVLKLSKKLYKKYDKVSSLAFSAMLILMWKPYYISDLGFILSYLSVLGIILFYDKFKKVLYSLPQYLNEGISMTLSAQSLSTPYALFYFKSLGSGFILGNIFLLPLYSMLLVLGNTALIFINMEYFFKGINYIISLVMNAIEGGIYLLLSICPPTIYFSYSETVAIFILYISYMLSRHCKKSFIYLPLCILIIGLYDNYKLFPEIHYMKIYNTAGILVRYKGDSVLFMERIPAALKDSSKGRGIYGVDEIQVLPKEDTIIKVGNKTKLKLRNQPSGNSRRDINLEIITPSRKTAVIFEGLILDGLNPKEYDIIYLNNRVENKAYEINKEIALVKIFFSKVYVIS